MPSSWRPCRPPVPFSPRYWSLTILTQLGAGRFASVREVAERKGGQERVESPIGGGAGRPMSARPGITDGADEPTRRGIAERVAWIQAAARGPRLLVFGSTNAPHASRLASSALSRVVVLAD